MLHVGVVNFFHNKHIFINLLLYFLPLGFNSLENNNAMVDRNSCMISNEFIWNEIKYSYAWLQTPIELRFRDPKE